MTRALGLLPLPALIASLVAPAPSAAEPAKRSMTLDDLAALRDVSDPRLSPEGDWVAYTVRASDLKEDKRSSDIWMARWDGARTVQLTFSKESEHSPRWSPDGRRLAFLSSRGVGSETDQLWLMSRAGGEAEKVTNFKGGVLDYAWSPDGKRLALVVKDPDPEAEERKEAPEKEKKTPRPIVIDRFQFKEDETGYLTRRRQHIHLLDLGGRKAELLTPGDFDEHLPSWSPDGSTIAFVSKRSRDPDRDDNYDVFLIAARPGAAARRLTSFEGADCAPDWESRPAWSPDGKTIAYPQGSRPELIYYGVHQLAIIPAAGGAARLLAPALDRNVAAPAWSADGASIYFLLEEERGTQLARIPSGGGRVDRVAAGPRQIDAFDIGAAGRIALLSGTPEEPFEALALDGGKLRPLSRQNDDLIAKLRIGAVEEITFRSKDGTTIHGFLVKPPDYQADRRYPALLRIHGGPVSQFDRRFMTEWQLFAASGYVVVAANPRGSSGRGEEFSRAIYADWGNKDAQDVLAAVDHAVERGIADPGKLGIGGWSYGGMLTNYTIAQDGRFKAATSGASISNIIAGYGTDQYIREYEAELGSPWTSLDVWMRVSFPFLRADRIVTPTLFLCGEKDFNVPLLNSEQMYQALRSLGVETQLVIYPGQHHGIDKPSYARDRMERYLAWYKKHM